MQSPHSILRLAGALGLLSLAVYASGCGCVDLACAPPGVQLDFSQPVLAGEVEVEVDTGDGVLRCTTEAPALTGTTCDDALSLGFAGPRTATSEGPSDRVRSVFVNGEHAQVSVQVFVDGTSRADATFEPRYRTLDRNSCTPCLGATETLTLADP